MNDFNLSAEEWLENEDHFGRDDRLARLKWLIGKYPSIDYVVFRGGLMTKLLFEEARYCFVYGQFLATIVLSLAFIEQTLAALFYMVGRNDLERAGAKRLVIEALKYNWLTQDECDYLDELRQIRNPIMHHRKLGIQPGEEVKSGWWRERIESRAIMENQLPHEILEQDARKALEIVFHLLGTSLMSASETENTD